MPKVLLINVLRGAIDANSKDKWWANQETNTNDSPQSGRIRRKISSIRNPGKDTNENGYDPERREARAISYKSFYGFIM